MKIKRGPLPKRFKWLAADKCGAWWSYTHKPKLAEEYGGWECQQNGGDWYEMTEWNILFKGNWKDSLHRRNGDDWEPVKK